MIPPSLWIDQGEILEAAIRNGYLAHIEETYCDPVTGAPELSERTARIECHGNRFQLVSGSGSFVGFTGWGDELTITALYDNPECVGCGEFTDRKDFTRCRPCTVEARAERQKAGVA